MKILAIETSCDETSVAAVQVDFQASPQIIAEEILSQTSVHVEYGGVVPELAAREHLANLPLLYRKVLDGSRLETKDFDLLAVTIGPGLKGCLLIGLGFAQGASLASSLPLVGVNHIEGHLLAPFLNNPELSFPYLALVVSGGHTQIVRVLELGKYQILAETIDDAAGEAFDKSAHLLGFAYPGGPELASLADSVQESRFSLPKVMKGEKDFSFSGLKTAISLLVKKHQEDLQDPQTKAELAYAIQDSIVDNLIQKLKLVQSQTGDDNLVITGGVAANSRLRQLAQENFNQVYCPDLLHCMDNAAMIALVAGMRSRADLINPGTKQVFSRLPITTDYE